MDNLGAGFVAEGGGQPASMDDLGLLRRVDPAVVDDDPFWSAVRRRHPDVAIVLLPDDPAPPGRVGPTLASEALTTVGERVVATWALLGPLVAAEGELVEPTVGWSPTRDGHALVVEAAVRGLGQDEGTDLLRAVLGALGAQEWRFAPGSRAGLPLLRATDGLLDLEGVAGPGAVVLTLATGVLPVTEPERAVVQARVAEAVASWR